MTRTYVNRRFPSALFKQLLKLARRNGCSVHEQARSSLMRQLDPALDRKGGTRTRRRPA